MPRQLGWRPVNCQLPVATRSVFQHLAELVERADESMDRRPSGHHWSVYRGGKDDETEPIGDAVRGLLDGHIRLDHAVRTGQFSSSIQLGPFPIDGADL